MDSGHSDKALWIWETPVDLDEAKCEGSLQNYEKIHRD